MNARLLLLISALMLSGSVLAWDGYDWEASSNVQIESGNLIRQGEIIEIYDWGTGEYHQAEVESVIDSGYSINVEIYDIDTDESRTFEMEHQ